MRIIDKTLRIIGEGRLRCIDDFDNTLYTLEASGGGSEYYGGQSGIITDIKRFAVHDGDGIRTTVFLKGCPLRCIWCHNPESISPKPQLSMYANKCAGCGECARMCPNGAHIFTTDTDGKPTHTIDREKCTDCGKCESSCLYGALKLNGRKMSVSEVMSTVLEDRIFYETGGGGMTLSGGEPTMQPDFVLALLKTAKVEGLNTALDTCGYSKQKVYESMLPYIDNFLYDIKHIKPDGHKRCTGHTNERIIENLRFLSDKGAKIEIRIPLVPGYNDDGETLHGIGKLLSEVIITKAKLLPYHYYARSKYTALDIADTLPDVEIPNKAKLETAGEILRSYNINVIIE